MKIRKIGRSAGNAVLKRVGRAVSRIQESKTLPADLLESDDAFLVVFDAPGVTMSDVQVRYDEGKVLVRVDRFREFHDGFEMVFPGRGLTLDGEVALPDGVEIDAEAASATLTDAGTLEVQIPKAPTAESEDATVDAVSNQ